MEKNADYYSRIYAKPYDVTRYQELYKTAAEYCKGKVLDMACGTQGLKQHLAPLCEYDGFDFAEIEGVRKGDIYKEPLEGYDTYVLLEVLEHIDDLTVIERIPAGKEVIFSVPTFDDAAHLRLYSNELMIQSRFCTMLDFKDMHTFTYKDGKHVDAEDGDAISMYLIRAVRNSNPRPELGAYMIVKNEEECLGKCLESLRGIDEIVILDTGSEDETEKVAANFACRFIEGAYTWNDDFAEARNTAMLYTSAKHLVIIDADEEFHGDMAKVRADVLKRNEIVRVVDTEAKGTGTVHRSIRVHRNNANVFWKGRCHNYLNHASGPAINGMKIVYGYSPAHKKDQDRALRILTKCCVDDPKAKRERYYLAREHYYRKQYEQALDHLKLYWKYGTFAQEIADSKLMAARCAIGMVKYDDAWKYATDALRINADFGEAFRVLAELSGPQNQRRWNSIADAATNSNVLFVRN